jgi:hypothetical protein
VGPLVPEFWKTDDHSLTNTVLREVKGRGSGKKKRLKLDGYWGVTMNVVEKRGSS